jgi:hypothetical protein
VHNEVSLNNVNLHRTWAVWQTIGFMLMKIDALVVELALHSVQWTLWIWFIE